MSTLTNLQYPGLSNWRQGAIRGELRSALGDQGADEVIQLSIALGQVQQRAALIDAQSVVVRSAASSKEVAESTETVEKAVKQALRILRQAAPALQALNRSAKRFERQAEKACLEVEAQERAAAKAKACLLYTSPSPRD